MKTIAEQMAEMLVVPVVVLNDAKDAKKLADALVEGGLPCAEVTFRTEAAEESIRIMAEEYPDMLVGAGTVLTREQVDRAVAAGAKFIVSPGFDPEIVDYCMEKEIPIFPGVVTPGGGQILSGRAVWRSASDQSVGSTLYDVEIYAHRWRKCEQFRRLFKL